MSVDKKQIRQIIAHNNSNSVVLISRLSTNALNETTALAQMDSLREKREKKYPYAISNWKTTGKYQLLLLGFR